jgi:hypothetical protein
MLLGRVSTFFTLCLCCLAFGCKKEPETKVEQAHAILTRKVVASSRTILATFKGRARKYTNADGNESSVRGTSSYQIEVDLPKGVQADLSKGQTVLVSLPIVHHSEVRARIDRVEVGKIKLILGDQVQELAGQEVRVQIPLRSLGLYRIPFEAVCSPRGLSKKVFVLQGDRVLATPVEVVAPSSDDGDIWIAGQFAPDSKIVIRGFDHLVTGDLVRVVSKEESLQ